MEKKIDVAGLISLLENVRSSFLTDEEVNGALQDCVCLLVDILYNRIFGLRESETDKES